MPTIAAASLGSMSRFVPSATVTGLRGVYLQAGSHPGCGDGHEELRGVRARAGTEAIVDLRARGDLMKPTKLSEEDL